MAIAKVLVVDDERMIASTLALILNQAGFDASAAYSGTEAIDAAKSTRPDLIISDVSMPGMNGIDAMILIRAFLPACKILLISGQTSVINLLQCARERGYDFELLAKPIHPSILIEKLRASIGSQ